MLQHIIRITKAQGYDGLRLVASQHNAPALALYEKNGFSRCGEVTADMSIDGHEYFCYQLKF